MNKCAAAIGTGVVLASAALGLAPQSEAGSWTMPNLIGHDLQGAQFGSPQTRRVEGHEDGSVHQVASA